MITTVQVLDRHIQNGTRRSCSKCMVSLAVIDVVKERVPVASSAGFLYVGELGFDDAISLPRFVGKKILEYDGDQEVTPFSFEVGIPERFLRGEGSDAG